MQVIVSSSGNGHDGIDLSAIYAVSKNIAPIITVSYGSCESAMSPSQLAFYDSLWTYLVNVFVQPSCTLKADQAYAFKAGAGVTIPLACAARSENCVASGRIAR